MISGVELFAAVVDFDPEATSAGYRELDAPDSGCCAACAAFANIIRLDGFPPALTDSLRRLGIDPAKPQEVYGLPEAGLIAGWWLFVGTIHTVWAGEARSAFEEPGPGLCCWITDRLVVHSWADPAQRTQLVQVEFEWRGDAVSRFASSSSMGG